jgi:hypothetical protein
MGRGERGGFVVKKEEAGSPRKVLLARQIDFYQRVVKTSASNGTGNMGDWLKMLSEVP